MDLYWDAVARLAWDIIRELAQEGGNWREEEVKQWDDLGPEEHYALGEFARAVGQVLNG